MDTLHFGYTNWRRETSERRAKPISIRFGISEYHPEPQWLMLAFDLEKGAEREFAMRDMWGVEPSETIPLGTSRELANQSGGPR